MTSKGRSETSPNACVVGVDIGASGCKAIVFGSDGNGNTRGSAQREYSRNTPNPGWVELDAEQWWLTVADTIKLAVKTSNITPEQIKSLGVSTETDGVVPIGDYGKPLRPYIHWSDARCYPQYDWILKNTDIEKIYRITGIPLHKSWWSPPGLKMLWIKENEPNVYAKTKKFVQIGNYVSYKLTGEYVNDYSVAARTMLFDIQKLDWSDDMAELLDIPLSTQPTIRKSAEIIGAVTEDASELTGLAPGTKVVAGGGDTECSGLSAGLTSEGKALASVGTSLMVLVASAKPPFLSDRKARQLSGTGVFSSCHVVDGLWLIEAGSMAGARLTWFKNEFGHIEDQSASSLGISVYDLLSVEAKSSGPSLNSPVFVISHDAIFNLTTEHKRGDVIRSIFEGVAFEAQQIIEASETTGTQVKSIIMVGGGSKSDVWRQIMADVTNRPVSSPDQSETAAFGAGILAGLGAHVFEDVGGATQTDAYSDNKPHPSAHEIYETLYRKFKALYESSRTQPVT